MPADEAILLPLDGSAFAETVLPVAASLGRRLELPLRLVSVVDPRILEGGTYDEPLESGLGVLPPGAARDVVDDLERAMTEYLGSVVRRLEIEGDVPASSEVTVGLVTESLDERIAEEEPALVVVATHGRGPFSRAWLGSVADHLVRHAAVPILLLRPDEEETLDGEGADLSADVPFRRILVPLDGSSRAEKVLPAARRIGEAHDGAVYELLRVVPTVHRFTSSYLPQTALDAGDVEKAAREEAREYLDALAARLGREGLETETELATGSGPAAGIIRRARESGADLIALASRGRGGLSRLLLGSVADKVVRSASAPVLVVRTEEEATGTAS